MARTDGRGATFSSSTVTVLGRRALSQWQILTVVFLVALLSATMLASLATLVNASSRFALPKALTSADASQTDVRLDLALGRRSRLAPTVTTAAGLFDATFAGLAHRHTEQTWGDALLADVGKAHSAFLFPAALDAVTDATTLTSGRWPKAVPESTTYAGTPVIETAMPVAAAAGLKLSLGGHLRVTNESGASQYVQLLLVGTYTIRDATDSLWALDPLHGVGHDPQLQESFGFGAYTTDGYGPVVIEQGAFTTAPAVSANAYRRIESPSLATVSAGSLGTLRMRLAATQKGLATTFAQGGVDATLTTRLDATLEQADRYLYVTNTSVLVSSLILLVLTFAALMLATRLLAERRVADQSLMRARGASGRQLVVLTLTEALLLAAAVTALAPLAARGVYALLATRRQFAGAGLRHDPGFPAGAWWAAASAALLFLVVLIAPLLRPAGTFVDQEAARSRQDRRTVLQRSGLDLGLVVLAVVAYTQLRSYQSPLLSSTGATSGLHLDPILVLGPALCLIAGSVLALRVVPAVSRLSEPLAARGRSVIGPLAAWELARRSKRATGAVLLVTLTVAVATFGLSYLSTWKTSQRDQAEEQVGADARLRLSVAPLLQGARVAALPGVKNVTPVVSRDVGFDLAENVTSDVGAGVPVQLLAAPSDGLANVLRGRTLHDGRNNVLSLLGELAPQPGSPVPTGAGYALPGRPTDLRLRVALSKAPFRQPFSAAISVVVQDATGVRVPLALGAVPLDGRPHVVTTSLVGSAPADASGARMSTPVSVVAMQFFWYPDITGGGRFTGGDVDSVTLAARVDHVATRDGTSAFAPVGFGAERAWNGAAATSSFGDFSGNGARDIDATSGGDVLLDGSVFSETATLADGVGASFQTWPTGDVVRVVATDGALGALGAGVGSDLVLNVGTTNVRATVVGRLPYVPGTSPSRPALLADSDSLSRALVERGDRQPLVDEWWVGLPEVTDADSPALALVAGDARAQQMSVVTRVDRIRDLQDAPLRVALQGALWLMVLAALVLVALGFAMHTAVTIRLRRTEFSQLRAIGLRRRWLLGAVLLENVLLVAIGGVVGVALGVLTTRLITPLVTLTAEGAKPLPGVVVDIPWPQLSLIAVEGAALLLLVMAVLAAALRGQSLATALRQGDER